MDLPNLESLCLSFPGATEDLKWGHDLCFCVGGKMFLVTCPDTFPISASIKVLDEEFEAFLGRDGCSPAPYVAKYKWILVDDIQRFSASEWQHLARQSYNLVRAKLPKKVLKTLSE